MEFIPIQICNIGKFIDALVIMMRFKYISNFELIEYKSVFIFLFLLLSPCVVIICEIGHTSKISMILSKSLQYSLKWLVPSPDIY